MREAHETGLTPMRPYHVEFPEDPKSWTVDDAYLFGRDLLVAPVLEAGARSWDVYLPKGATWRDAWTGEEHEGGQTVTVPAPLDRIPLFLRDGATLPIGPADGS
jgi:alpha-D-xyloside xylohydrolase